MSESDAVFSESVFSTRAGKQGEVNWCVMKQIAFEIAWRV